MADPRYELHFANGATNAANLTASGGEAMVSVAPQNWFAVVSNSTLPACALNPARVTFKGLEAFSAALATGALPALEVISLHGNPASDKAQQAVDKIIKSRQ